MILESYTASHYWKPSKLLDELVKDIQDWSKNDKFAIESLTLDKDVLDLLKAEVCNNMPYCPNSPCKNEENILMLFGLKLVERKKQCLPY